MLAYDNNAREIEHKFKMASFDFVESSAKAYRFTWQRREDVFRLSAMVLALKILTFVGLVVFGLDNNVLPLYAAYAFI